MKIKSFKQNVDILFLSVLLCFTLFDVALFNEHINDRVLLFVCILSLWLLFKLVVHKINTIPISIYDVGFVVLFLYFNINFYLFSNTTFYYSRYVACIGYFFVFYIFRWFLHNHQFRTKKIHYFFLLIIVLCINQSTFSLIQYAGLVSVKNPYFTLVGSFSSPNYLALYVSFGMIILLWYLFIIKSTNKGKNIFTSIGLLLMGVVITLSNSRGTFLSLFFSSFVLWVTSEKSTQWLLKNIRIKKILVVASITTLLFFAFKYLYFSEVSSINGRKLIAKITLQEIAKNPLKGYGAFNFIGGYNKSKSTYFLEQDRAWEEVRVGNYVFTSFNDYLLIGYELGLPCLLLLLALIIIIVFKTKSTNTARIGIALLVNVLVWSFFNSAIMNIPIMLISIFSFSILLTEHRLQKLWFLRKKSSKRIVSLFLYSFCVVGIYFGYLKIIASITLEEKINNPSGAFDKSKFIALSQKLENNSTRDFKIGLTLYHKGYVEEGFLFMEKSFKHTCHPKIGKNLATLYLKEENFKRAEEIYKINEGLEPFRYGPKMDRIALMRRLQNHTEVVRLSQKVVDSPVKIPSETVNNYKDEAQNNVIFFTEKIKSFKKNRK